MSEPGGLFSPPSPLRWPGRLGYYRLRRECGISIVPPILPRSSSSESSSGGYPQRSRQHRPRTSAWLLRHISACACPVHRRPTLLCRDRLRGIPRVCKQRPDRPWPTALLTRKPSSPLTVPERVALRNPPHHCRRNDLQRGLERKRILNHVSMPSLRTRSFSVSETPSPHSGLPRRRRCCRAVRPMSTD